MLTWVRSKVGAPSPATVIAFMALVVAVGGVTYAAIPSGDGTITGCYSTDTGALRVIDAAKADACEKGEKALSWRSGAEVRGEDIAANAVSRPKIAGGAVNGGKVADNSLTGADILESSLNLGKVANANLLDGKDASAFGGPTQGFEFVSTEAAKIAGYFVNVHTSSPLPVGAYYVVARVEAVNAAGKGDKVECRIQTLPDGLVRDVAGQSGLSHYHMTLLATFATLEPATIGVDCTGVEGAMALTKIAVLKIDSAG